MCSSSSLVAQGVPVSDKKREVPFEPVVALDVDFIGKARPGLRKSARSLVDDDVQSRFPVCGVREKAVAEMAQLAIGLIQKPAEVQAQGRRRAVFAVQRLVEFVCEVNGVPPQCPGFAVLPLQFLDGLLMPRQLPLDGFGGAESPRIALDSKLEHARVLLIGFPRFEKPSRGCPRRFEAQGFVRDAENLVPFRAADDDPVRAVVFLLIFDHSFFGGIFPVNENPFRPLGRYVIQPVQPRNGVFIPHFDIKRKVLVDEAPAKRDGPRPPSAGALNPVAGGGKPFGRAIHENDVRDPVVFHPWAERSRL